MYPHQLGAVATSATSHRSALAWAAAACALYAVALFVSGLFLHPITAIGAENDNYIAQARMLLEGVVPRDVFHPLLYPICTALISFLTGDYFVAGKAVSAASAGLLVWTTWAFVRLALTPACALLAAAWVAVHPYVVVNGLEATSDLLGAALMMATLLSAVLATRSRAFGPVVLLGFAFAMAYWARYPAMALLVPIAMALCLPWQISHGRRLARFAAFGACTALFLIPHFALTQVAFGQILHDETWRTLSLAHYADFDHRTLMRVDFDSWRSVLAHDPARIVSNSVSELGRLFGHDLPGHLTGRTGHAGLFEWGLYALLVVAVLISILGNAPPLVLAGSFAAVYMVALCLSIAPWTRYLVPALPPMLAGCSALMLGVEHLTRERGRPVTLGVQGVVGTAIVVYVALGVPALVSVLEARHPHAEYAAIEGIIEAHGSDVRIGTPAFIVRNHLDFELLQVPFPFEGDGPDLYVQALEEYARSQPVDFIVVGRASIGHRALEALAAAEPLAGLRVLPAGEDALVLEPVR